ncbi:MAG TPA: nitric oxide reductase transcriptional regulator NorR [Spongiibacteraceae bacterium]|nr:nitric oxide reductase transcriptional regulator NorR [Spongiibacteraceae bacterium]HCS28964.1 nitric oxide reductase transcriptional regulator NorR [Spongiibacteraceae bacterium]|tara:strand:+ start:519 stop:2060 length:1542 start_codon:yes stop_codon:yes gene_type:complete
MTSHVAFADMAEIVADLSLSMPRELRYKRLLGMILKNFPCDAIALLERENGFLIPKATQGLSPDTMGRRFEIQNHPRLAQILDSRKPIRFSATSELPDPYDGLIENTKDHLYVHDCMGATLYIDNIPWGVVTLDALDPSTFDNIDMNIFEAFLGVASATVRAASWIQQLEDRLERRQIITSSQSARSAPIEIIGESLEISQLIQEAQTVAASDLTVLILGETGVGKELIANYIHHHSSRASEPMIYLNCAALPESLAESELFGHMKGSFTGATESRAGKFELAHEGTLFLDEVGELPLAIQSKLLRALQNGDIQRIGSDKHHNVDVRIIAATNRDLKKEVAEGRFRPDLYHRLSIYPLVIPPLRERPGDILTLAGYFLERGHRRMGVRGVRLSNRAKRWLTKSTWPGNIRELEHTLSRAVIRALSEGQDSNKIIEIDVPHLGVETLSATSSGVSKLEPELSLEVPLSEAVDDYKRQVIFARLEKYGGNKAAAARSLGVDRGNFVRQLKRLNIE